MVDSMMMLGLVFVIICDGCLIVFVECIKNKISEYIDIELIMDIISIKMFNLGKFCFVDMDCVEVVCD